MLGHGFEIAGLTPDRGDEPPMWSDMLSATLMYRRHGALPEDSVYISSDGTDLSYFPKCSRVVQALEGVVIEWGPDHADDVYYENI